MHPVDKETQGMGYSGLGLCRKDSVALLGEVALPGHHQPAGEVNVHVTDVWAGFHNCRQHDQVVDKLLWPMHVHKHASQGKAV